MTLGWVEKQCVFCGKGKGETVRCPNDVDKMVVDFWPCIECQALHKGKVVVAEALAQDEITGRHVLLTRDEAELLLISTADQYCLIDSASFDALFYGKGLS